MFFFQVYLGHYKFSELVSIITSTEVSGTLQEEGCLGEYFSRILVLLKSELEKVNPTNPTGLNFVEIFAIFFPVSGNFYL